MNYFSARRTSQLTMWLQKLTEDAYTEFNESPAIPLPSSANPCAAAMPRPSPLHDLLSKRKSSRAFSGDVAAISDCVEILRLAYGYTAGGRRSVPSAGGFYPLQLWLAELKRGSIERVGQFDPLTGEIDHFASLDAPVQDGFRVFHVDYTGAHWMILWTVRLLPIAERYGARGYRFAVMEVGMSVQCAILACCSLGLPHIVLGGLIEQHVRLNWLRTGRRYAPQCALLLR